MQETWDMSGRDVVPDLAPAGRPRDPGAAMLLGMLNADGRSWTSPYREVRAAANIRYKAIDPELQHQADSRLRTYLTLFRGLGFVYEESQVLHVTDLGKSLRNVLQDQYSATDDLGRELANANRWRLARLVAPALSRYQLENPLSQVTYPAGTDIHPLWAIWRAMRSLDNRLHWDEFDRTLTSCLRQQDLPEAIDRIRLARMAPDYDARNPAVLDNLLGPRKPVVDSQADRVDVWFSRAGFKGLLLEPRDRPDGYQYLSEDFLPLIDEMLETEPEYVQTADRTTYVQWLGQAPTVATLGSLQADRLTTRVIDRCRRYGESHIIALVGPAGTGKTRVAREAALALVENDSARTLTVQFHAATTYEEFIGGLAPTVTGTFEPKPGTLLNFNTQALLQPDEKYVLIIDELSRADVANVLGELLTYVEYRDRSFHVPALGREIRLARNLVIIATLNPEDRSVVNMDDALIRRLRQVPVKSSVDALREILSDSGMEAVLIDEVTQWFSSLPDDAPFGHGLFVGVRDENDLYDLWHEQLAYFLRRGGLTVYPDPDSIEKDFRWRYRQPAAIDADYQADE